MPGPIHPPIDHDSTTGDLSGIPQSTTGDFRYVPTDIKPEFLQDKQVNMELGRVGSITSATGILFREDSNTVPENIVTAVINVEHAVKDGALSAEGAVKALEMLKEWSRRPTYISNNRITIDGVQQQEKP